jgi:hypothetical protein
LTLTPRRPAAAPDFTVGFLTPGPELIHNSLISGT